MHADDARALVETALDALWWGDWERHLQWIASIVALGHGHADWPPRPSLWQRLCGTDHTLGSGHAAYTAAMRPIAAGVGQAHELFRRHIEQRVYPVDPATDSWEVHVRIHGVNPTTQPPLMRVWHYHPVVRVREQRIVVVNLYDRQPEKGKVYFVPNRPT